MFGTTENKVQVLLGEKEFDVHLYVNRVRHNLELQLTDGKLPRNSLQLSLSIVVPSRMGEIGVSLDSIDKSISNTVADFSKDTDFESEI